MFHIEVNFSGPLIHFLKMLVTWEYRLIKLDRISDYRNKGGAGIASTPTLCPTEPPIQWVPEVKRPGREADHSPPTSAEVKRTWIYTSTPPYVFMAYGCIR
jgi:hypothetical protein